MNAFTLSVRYLASRKLESFLAVPGIVLGVATLAGTLSLVPIYKEWFASINGAGSVLAEANLDSFYRELVKRESILALMAILASACALAAAINLFNLMTRRVVRRRKQIAIIRAVGATRVRVFEQIMIEASLIGVSGVLAGMALSPLVVMVLGRMLEGSSRNQKIPVSVDLTVLLLVGFGALVVSLVVAAIPAKNGSSLVITDALDSEQENLHEPYPG
jgi:putative ABC transport system permease protein